MIPWLEPDSPFPDTHQALGPDSDAPGLLAAGEDLSIARLEAAYQRGIFPWFSPGQPVLWWTTDPRMVLSVANFKVSKSLRKTIKKFRSGPNNQIRVDHAFESVIRSCAETPRDGQSGTWIVPAIQQIYTRWHKLGRVHSFETWWDGQLCGGLYGISMGRMFFGESMFSHRTDASKIALAALVCFCRRQGIDLIDCQQETTHLASMGAAPITRDAFETHLRGVIHAPSPDAWTYHDNDWSALDDNA